MKLLSHILGLDDVSGYLYAWWSGIAGDLAIFGTSGALLMKHNCHHG